MYRLLRHSLALNKKCLPISRQLVPFYSSSTIKDKDEAFELDSRQLISSYSSSTMKDKAPELDSSAVTNQLDEIFENSVHKNKRSMFKMLREIEKKNFNLELAAKLAEKDRYYLELAAKLAEKDRYFESQLAKQDKELAVAAIKMGHLNLNYLRLKGAVHLRGVFEQWESFNLSSIDGNRGTKWTKYLNSNEKVFEAFRNFWPNPDEIEINHVVEEMKSFYRWLSERIHNSYATGDYVEWRRNTLSPVRNKVAEFMCNQLYIEYRIVESLEEIEEIEVIKETTKNE